MYQYFGGVAQGNDSEQLKALGMGVVISMEGDAEFLNLAAWTILTHEAIRTRHLDVAMKAAELAYKACDGKDAAIVDTYARAFYDTGDKKRRSSCRRRRWRWKRIRWSERACRERWMVTLRGSKAIWNREKNRAGWRSIHDAGGRAADLNFIKGIAEYEKLSHEVVATEETLHDSLFGENPCAEALLAFQGETPVAYAIFFHNFSTFIGRRGLYLEDLYVKPEYRARGIGKKLLIYLAGLAKERDCGRFEWWPSTGTSPRSTSTNISAPR